MADQTWANSVVFGGESFVAGPRVQLTTIDKIVSELKLARVDVVKMDIEGSERNAVAGAAKTLALHKPRLALAAYHLEDDTAVLPEIVRQAQSRYEVCLQGKGWGSATLFFR